jgi:anti-anti-sigma regulatory factor
MASFRHRATTRLPPSDRRAGFSPVVDVNKLTFVDASGPRALAVLQVRAEQRLIAVRLSGVPAQTRRLRGIIGPDRNFPSRGRAPEAAVKRQRLARTWPETCGACGA